MHKKGKSQAELQILWSTAALVQGEEEIYGEWRWEKNNPGFMEIIINLDPGGKGTYFNSGRGEGFHDPIL